MKNPSQRRISQWAGQGARLFGRSLAHMLEGNCFTHAAAIAYYLIFSIFPLLLLAIGVLGFFLEGEDTRKQVIALAAQYFPVGARRLIADNINAIVTARDSLSFLSAAGLLWSATFMFDEINHAINVAWGVTEREHFVSAKIKSIFIVLVLLLAILSSTLLTTQEALIQRFESLLLRVPWGEVAWQLGHRTLSLVGRIVSWSMIVLAFALAYRFLPRAKVSFGDIWVAALLAATAWELSKRAFIWYVTRVANYSQVYGSIGAVLVLLLWTYLSALILIWGAEIAAEQTRLRNESSPALA
jgi:membrane protein